MRHLLPLTSRSFCVAVGIAFVVLSAVFVLVPYSLSQHPWEEARAIPTASVRT